MSSAHLSNRRPWFWPGLLFVACVLLTLVLWLSRGWVCLGVPPINVERTPFTDTSAQVESAMNCANMGDWHGRVCFVPSIESVPRMQAYEPWLSFQRWGLLDSVALVPWLAWAMVLGFAAALAFTLRPASAGQTAVAFALFATSAVQLAVERGNFDLLIASLLCLAGASLASSRPRAAVTGALILSLATMLKLYTGLATLMAWTVTRVSWRIMLPVSVLALLLAVFVVGPRELWVLGQGAPEGATRFSTGARWLFLQHSTAAGIAAIGLAVAVAAAALLWLRRESLPDPFRWPRRVAVFQLAFLTAVPLFLLKDSYDYRFVLWLPCLALPLAWLARGTVSTRWRALAIALIALFVFVAGVEMPAYWLDHLSARGHGWATTTAAALGLAKQFAAWLLAALLTALYARMLHLQWQVRRLA